MAAEKWSQVKEILDAAIRRKPEERSAFLDEACNGDEHVRREVESLLSSFGRADGFMERGVTREAPTIISRTLAEGDTLGHYRIIGRIGTGGMGEVYAAHDTKLDRKVAIKFMSAEFGSDADKIERFTREAKAAAALNHPNIAHVYEIGNEDGVNFIAMEFIDGVTLGSLPSGSRTNIGRQLDIAAQIASGLAAAHRAGIVHRDIKPDNVMIVNGSQAKILDFGLAKLAERPVVAASEDTTHALANTTPGMILGTVSYMSPEQARGEQVDSRTDIFSLGVVLYEMLAGRKPFDGKSVIETLHAIINQEPTPVAELNPRLPPEISEILEKALAKDVGDRYHHAGDLELDLRRLKRVIESNSLISSQSKPISGARARTFSFKWIIPAGLVLFAATAGAWWFGNSRVPPERAQLENITLTPLTSDPGYEGEPTFSPDGETIAYVSDRTGNFEIYLKQISGGPDVNITNNPSDDVQPSFSPDGKQIAFVSTRGGSPLMYPGVDISLLGGDIWVMPTLGGSPRRIAESGNFPAWSPDGSTIVYMKANLWFQPKMRRVSAQGGESQDIPITFPAEVPAAPFWMNPSYSPDGKWIAFTGSGIFVVSSEGGEAKRIVSGKYPVWSADSRSIIYSNTEPGKNYSLWRVPVSPADMSLAGVPQPLTIGRGRDMQPALSHDGKRIVYAAQDVSFNVESLPFEAELGRQTGPPQSVTTGNNAIYFLSGSPEGKSVVFQCSRGSIDHICKTDIGSSLIQLTSDPNYDDAIPRFSPDGKTIAFVRRKAGETKGAGGKGASLWLMAADGGNPRLLVENAGNPTWAPSGNEIVYGTVGDENRNQLNIIDLRTNNVRLLTNEVGVVPISAFSPDGKWLVHQSNTGGDINLRAVPIDGGETMTVVETTHQDYHPSFSPSGKWLYFQLDHKNVWRVPGPAQNWRKADPEKVTNFPESGLFLEDPQISHDGRQLLFSRGRITGDIWIMDLGKISN
jgi:serine/threonine protein kinase